MFQKITDTVSAAAGSPYSPLLLLSLFGVFVAHLLSDTWLSIPAQLLLRFLWGSLFRRHETIKQAKLDLKRLPEAEFMDIGRAYNRCVKGKIKGVLYV